MKQKNTTFKIGDTVKVKTGIKDPDFDSDIAGWVGRVLEIGNRYLLLEWDSETLLNMSAESIVYSEEEGWDWSRMELEIADVELTQARNSIEDTLKTYQRLLNYHQWDDFEEQGTRIQSVLTLANSINKLELFKTWQDYLQNKLTFPFEVEIVEGKRHSGLRLGDKVKVLAFTEIDEMQGILVMVSHKKGTSQLPLCDLEVVKQSSPDYDPVKDYVVWFANR